MPASKLSPRRFGAKEMKLFGWITDRLSFRDRAMSLYKRGMKQAKLHDHEAALANYSAVIDGADTPPDLRAMALYNRAVVYAATRSESRAVGDLETLLEMTDAAPNVKTEARRKLVRIRRSSDPPVDRRATRDA